MATAAEVVWISDPLSLSLSLSKRALRKHSAGADKRPLANKGVLITLLASFGEVFIIIFLDMTGSVN